MSVSLSVHQDDQETTKKAPNLRADFRPLYVTKYCYLVVVLLTKFTDFVECLIRVEGIDMMNGYKISDRL